VILLHKELVLTKKNARGFTLIELLAVLSIIAIMTSLSSLGINSLMQSRSLQSSISEIASTVELAQSYATANKRPVWVRISNATQDAENLVYLSIFVESEGETGLVLYNPLVKNKKLPRVKLVEVDDIEPMNKNLLGAVGGGFSIILPAKSNVGSNFSTDVDYIFRVGPQGELQISPGVMPRRLEIALSRSNAGELRARVLSIDGLIGSIEWRDSHVK